MATAEVIDLAESTVRSWRSLTVHIGSGTDVVDVQAVTDLLMGVELAAADAGYHGCYDGTSADFTLGSRCLRWSWASRGQPVTAVLAAVRDLADTLNPGGWTVTADLT